LGDGFRCALVSWAEVEAWVDKIIHTMDRAGFAPDIVIGMSRGGIVPSRLICDHLVVKNLFTVKTEHWGLTATPDGKARLAQALNTDITGRSVLIVDDITDTGQSLILARDHISSLGPGELRSATLLHITHSLITPDYFAKEVAKEEWTWFIFPWNIREDLRNIVPQALDEPEDVEGLRKALAERYHIRPEEHMVRETLDRLVESGKVVARGKRFQRA
jgi:hypoxanthine phosphoribosyltransferase